MGNRLLQRLKPATTLGRDVEGNFERALGSCDDFVGAARHNEVDTIFAVGCDGGLDIEGRNLDASHTVSGLGVVYTVRVEDAANDGVVGNLFAMAVAVNEDSGREWGGRDCLRLPS